MTQELTLIPAPELTPNGLAAVLNEQLLDDGSAFGHYNVTHLVNSPTNRKRFNPQKLQELSASIREKGVAQPILIRPAPAGEDGLQRYEIIAGERRWRGSILAERTHIPALCRKLSDHDAAELQILENLQREDPHPLEEAEGYERLMQTHGYSADQLTERLKKSRSYIYGRLKLCALSLDVREPFLDNDISASTALLIARIPVPELQKRALQEILKPQYGSEPLSYRAAQAHIASRYTLALDDAPFDVKDAKLLAVAGSCAKCPKLTGNQPEIYADAKSADVCTDPDCFAEKKAAHYQRIVVLANKRGIPVLEGKEAGQILGDKWNRESEFVTADTHLSSFQRVAPATGMSGYVADRLDAQYLPTPVKYTKTADGAVQPIYKRADIQAALEQAGACETEAVRASRLAAEAQDPTKAAALTKTQQQEADRIARAEALKKRADTLTENRIGLYRAVRQRAKQGLGLNAMRALACHMVDHYPVPDDLLRDEYPAEASSDEAVKVFINTAELPTLRAIILDLLLGEFISIGTWDVERYEEGELDGGFQIIHTIALAERLWVPTEPLDLTALKNPSDVHALLAANEDRLAELASKIIEDAPHHLGNVEAAANALGWFFGVGGWRQDSPAADSEKHRHFHALADESVAEDATGQQASTPRAKLQLKAKPPAPAAANGPIVKIKKNRAASLQPSDDLPSDMEYPE
jgi:ParB/RepB/Spo0J family partition protein